MKFVSWHTHTGYSYADGLGSVRTHVERAAELGMSALGLSEHGNANCWAALERECRSAGLKPQFGIEAYLSPPEENLKFHMGLYAMNDEGLHNLNRLITESYLDFKNYPTVLWEKLRKHNAGIVAFSGCSDSLISCTLLGGKSLGEKRGSFTEKQYAHTRRRVERFHEVFEERFYLEVQRFPQLPRTCTLNPAFERISADTGVPLIATADVHYPYPEQNEIQKVMHASRRKGSVALNEQEWEYGIKLTYPESDEEIIRDLISTGLTPGASERAVLETANLSERCEVILPKASKLRFPVEGQAILCDRSGNAANDDDLETVKDFQASLVLRQWVKDGWRRRVQQRPDLAQKVRAYNKRISHEMKVISDKGFDDYFLVVADLVQKAKYEDDVTVGPGRGSAAGSLVCYLLGITEIDPLHPTFSRMVFERFIDPTRSDMPDIDLDFDDALRWKTPERARQLYGMENVANVANHISYRGKSALAGTAAAYGLSRKFFDEIGKRCAVRVETDDRVDDSIKDTLENYSSNPKIATLVDTHRSKIDQAIELEGNPHSMGIHAGGFVIASEPIPDFCALYTKEKGSGRQVETVQVIPYEKRDAEYLKMLKMDFLGLTTMGQIGMARQWTSMHLDELYNLYYKDYEDGSPETKAILDRFQTDDVVGIFQYEGGTTRQVVREVQPSTMDELAACNALSRPGPYYGGQTSEYIRIKNGEKDWRRIHPAFDRHVDWTYGQIVYQEQIMWILRDLAGFPIDRVLRVRKIIGKKLGEFQFAELWNEFKDGCSANGVGEEDAASVWRGITTAAGYAFNTAHAYSYALVAWWQMWFKIHHTPEFFGSSLAKNGDGKDDISRRTALLKDCRTHQVPIMPMQLTDMYQNWSVYGAPNGGAYLMPGFMQMPDIGPATADDIVNWLDGSNPVEVDISWDSMALPPKKGGVSGIGEVTVEKLKAFSQMKDPFRIDHTEEQLNEFRRQLAAGEFSGFGLPPAEYYVSSNRIPDINAYVAWVGLVSYVSEKDEVEQTRNKTGKSVADIKAGMDRPEDTKKATLFAYDEFGEVALGISRFRFATMADAVGTIKEDHHVVVGYGRVFQGRAGRIQLEKLWYLEPD